MTSLPEVGKVGDAVCVVCVPDGGGHEPAHLPDSVVVWS